MLTVSQPFGIVAAHTEQIFNQKMRTKTLLLTAAILAGSLATSLAQATNVYSANIVGYVNKVNVPGYQMIANPLNGTNNTVVNIFAGPPDYLTVFKRNALGTGYDSSTFDPDAGPGGAWTAPGLTLAPGEGAFLFNPLVGNYTNTFVGEVTLDSTNTYAEGYSIRASVVPQSGGIQTVLLLPVSPSDPKNSTIFRFNAGGSGYKSYTYDTEDLGGTWTSSAIDGPEPSPGVGEAFWIANGTGNGTKQWIRHFTVN